MTRNHRWRVLAATATALTLTVTALSPAAQARPATHVVATWHMPAPGFYDIRTGMNAVWAVLTDEVHRSAINRIDPVTGVLTTVTTLPFQGGGLAVGDDSLWVSDYFGNAVWRVAPDGHILARIAVGLQPQWVHIAFGSVWVSNHHGASVSRVDPATNTVVATIAAGQRNTFRSGPQDITDDGSRIYVGSSNAVKLESIDPATNIPTVPRPTAGGDEFCGDLLGVSGLIWSVDDCTGRTYLLTPSGTPADVIDSSPGQPGGATVLGNDVWLSVDRTVDPNTGVGSNAALERRDSTTGALLSTVAIGGDAAVVRAGFQHIWVYDSIRNTVREVQP